LEFRLFLDGEGEDRCEDGPDFFFSSRRRHTRSDRDWSSDVCSSDLCAQPSPCISAPRSVKPECRRRTRVPPSFGSSSNSTVVERSEERRVGKRVDLRGRRALQKKK